MDSSVISVNKRLFNHAMTSIQLRTALEEANISRAELGNTLKLTETELEQTHEHLEEELESKDDLIKFLNKERQEGAYWKQKYETEALGVIEDLEEQR